MKISLDHFSSHQLEEEGLDLTSVDQLSNREELCVFVPLQSLAGGLCGWAPLDMFNLLMGFFENRGCSLGERKIVSYH